MAYDPKRKTHSCDACSRVHNDGTTLVRATNPDRPLGDRSMQICGTQKCTRIANESGYFTAGQIERGEHTSG